MSRAAVRQALETALNGMSPAISTAWENVPFEPVVDTPYQAAFLLGAEPESIEAGTSYRERGIFQINLNYPLNTGPGAAEARAELIRDTFPRGATFTADGVTTRIETQPEIGTGRAEEDRYFVPVRCRFYSNIIRS